MVTVAIISEYNPFHLGHEYHIKKIREEFGEDTAIIAIMSGNYTQRGEVAIADKFLRAKLSVLSGVNLALELPFPYSMSSAEFFASAGVRIADKLGCVDYLSFGSELGSTEQIVEMAKRMSTEEYKSRLDYNLRLEENAPLGYPSICERTYIELYHDAPTAMFSPNNILAFEYIKALTAQSSSIKPHTVMRKGTGYNGKKISNNELPSAMAIRELLSKGDVSALDFVPNSTKNELSKEIGKSLPTDPERLGGAIISSLRLNTPRLVDNIHDATGGLYNRLHSASFDADSIQSLTALSVTKKYTTARIKRAVWYSYIGVTSSDVRSYPEYTQALALDGVGRGLLKTIKKTGAITVITKPSRTEGLSEAALKQKELSDKADSIFHLTKPTFTSGKYSILSTPFVKK